MNIIVISASNRAGSQSKKVSEWLRAHIVGLGHDASIIDLYELALPLYDDAEHPELAEKIHTLKKSLVEADGAVFVSPEWDGMMSLSLANMFHYITNELAHKPVMLVGVSSGRGGAYPIAQMKQIGQKNRHFVVSPENLIIGSVESMLNTQEIAEDDADIAIKKRADYAVRVLLEYANALHDLRTRDTIKNSPFPNGV